MARETWSPLGKMWWRLIAGTLAHRIFVVSAGTLGTAACACMDCPPQLRLSGGSCGFETWKSTRRSTAPRCSQTCAYSNEHAVVHHSEKRLSRPLAQCAAHGAWCLGGTGEGGREEAHRDIERRNVGQGLRQHAHQNKPRVRFTVIFWQYGHGVDSASSPDSLRRGREAALSSMCAYASSRLQEK